MRPLHAFGIAVLLLLAAASPALLLTLRSDSILAHGAGLEREGSFLFGRMERLDPANDSLVIVAPDVGYTEREVRLLHAFLMQGGRVLVADDGGVTRDLLERLGVGVGLTGSHVFTPAFRDLPDRVVALATPAASSLPREVVLSRPVAVEGGEPLLVTPDLAWLDRNDNGRPDLNEPLQRSVVAAQGAVGSGLLVVAGDPDLLLSAPPEVGDALLSTVSSGDRRIVWDEGHRPLSDPLALNGLLAGRMGLAAVTSILMFTAAIAAFAALGPRMRALRERRVSPWRAEGADPRLLREALAELDKS